MLFPFFFRFVCVKDRFYSFPPAHCLSREYDGKDNWNQTHNSGLRSSSFGKYLSKNKGKSTDFQNSLMDKLNAQQLLKATQVGQR